MTKTKIKKGTFRSKQESQYRNFWQNNIKGFACESQWGKFSEFKEVVGPRTSGKHFLRKINSEAPATPDNVHWTTARQSRAHKSCKYMIADKSLRSTCKNQNQYQLTLSYVKNYGLEPKTALTYACKPRDQKRKIKRAALVSYLREGKD